MPALSGLYSLPSAASTLGPQHSTASTPGPQQALRSLPPSPAFAVSTLMGAVSTARAGRLAGELGARSVVLAARRRCPQHRAGRLAGLDIGLAGRPADVAATAAAGDQSPPCRQTVSPPLLPPPPGLPPLSPLSLCRLSLCLAMHLNNMEVEATAPATTTAVAAAAAAPSSPVSEFERAGAELSRVRAGRAVYGTGGAALYHASAGAPPPPDSGPRTRTGLFTRPTE